MFGDKTIVKVHVPIKDLIQESNGVVRFMTYEVQTTDGKANGVLNFSFKVNGKDKRLLTDSPASQIAGYPVFIHHQSPESIFYWINYLSSNYMGFFFSFGYKKNYFFFIQPLFLLIWPYSPNGLRSVRSAHLIKKFIKLGS